MAVARLVVLRALGLGDLLTAVPALRALAERFPAHRRVLAAPAALTPLARADDLVHEVADVDLRAGAAPAPERPLPAALHAADVAVNLHGRGPQSSRMLAATGPRRLLAFAHPEVPATAGGPAWRDDEHEAERWCRLLQAAAGIPADPARLDLPVPPARDATGAPASGGDDAPASGGHDAPAPDAAGATVLHPGAASPARRWPLERWAALARAERNRGRRVVVTGSAAEAGLARQVAAAAGLDSAAVLAGRTDVAGLAGVIAAAGRVVCGDTGVAHLATATGTPSVVLFGPTSPARWGPPADRPQHRVLWSGSTGDPHARRTDEGLLAITVDDVAAALADVPERPDRREARVSRARHGR